MDIFLNDKLDESWIATCHTKMGIQKFLICSCGDTYWEILFWPPIILLLHGSRHINTLHQERIPGDSNAEAVGHNTQENCKFEESYKHSASLDRLIRKLMDEEKERI
ncbi:hypothetical protein TNCV_599101 [Trichonephila clavipes]|nr:hypothetical protein TNCV_599101 [Trichonephila clavipes]